MNYKSTAKWYRLAIAAASTLLISIWLGTTAPKALQASNVPEASPIIAQNVSSAIWKHGSFPVENFQSYTSPFGYRISPVDGQRQFHNGLDMAAPRGSYVRSWWTGTVTQVSDNTACGTSVSINSGEWSHTYCHLEGHVEYTSQGRLMIDRAGGIQIVQGQQVPVGARIGRIGMTGRTTGPHLHWVLKHKGSYVDPGLVLKEMFKSQTASIDSSYKG
jgi:murein DD-endopeptidase MepM/ murein hydrolase activator NlpD